MKHILEKIQGLYFLIQSIESNLQLLDGSDEESALSNISIVSVYLQSCISLGDANFDLIHTIAHKLEIALEHLNKTPHDQLFNRLVDCHLAALDILQDMPLPFDIIWFEEDIA